MDMEQTLTLIGFSILFTVWSVIVAALHENYVIENRNGR